MWWCRTSWRSVSTLSWVGGCLDYYVAVSGRPWLLCVFRDAQDSWAVMDPCTGPGVLLFYLKYCSVHLYSALLPKSLLHSVTLLTKLANTQPPKHRLGHLCTNRTEIFLYYLHHLFLTPILFIYIHSRYLTHPTPPLYSV